MSGSSLLSPVLFSSWGGGCREGSPGWWQPSPLIPPSTRPWLAPLGLRASLMSLITVPSLSDACSLIYGANSEPRDQNQDGSSPFLSPSVPLLHSLPPPHCRISPWGSQHSFFPSDHTLVCLPPVLFWDSCEELDVGQGLQPRESQVDLHHCGRRAAFPRYSTQQHMSRAVLGSFSWTLSPFKVLLLT